MAVPEDQVENGEPASPSAHREYGEDDDDPRESVREVIAIGPSSLQRLTIFGSDRRHSGHF
jgi:hypothetical protein